jgi:hypothetical protein
VNNTDEDYGDYIRDKRIDDALTEPWTRVDKGDGSETLVPNIRVRELCRENGDDFHKVALSGSYHTAFAYYEAPR